MAKAIPHIDIEKLKEKKLSRKEIIDGAYDCAERFVKRIDGTKMRELVKDMVFLGETPEPNEIKWISKKWLAFAQEVLDK